MLARAGMVFHHEAPNVDEDEIKLALKGEGATAIQVAETLAELKARRVSQRHADLLVIGADQMLDCGGEWFDKPRDRAAAAANLRALSGRTHNLETSVCVCRNDSRLWHHNARARLTMRLLSDDFIERYLDAVGDAALGSVGGYQLEGLGVQLFSRVEGDFFTILGLPLLQLLDFLRGHSVVPA